MIANRWSAYINLYFTMCTQHHTICADCCGRCCRYGRSYGLIGPYTVYLAKWNKNSKQASHFLFTCFVLIRFRLSRFFFFTVRRYSLLFGFNRCSLAAFFSAFQLCVFLVIFISLLHINCEIFIWSIDQWTWLAKESGTA